MGSLSFALGGALAGAGAGAAHVGQEINERIMREGLERLRNDYANQRQQTAIEAEAARQKQGQTFQHGETEEAARRAVAAAGATRTFEEEQNRLGRKSRETVGAGHDTARLDAAALAAYQRSSTAAGKSTIKPFQARTMKVADPRNALSPPIDRAYDYDPNTGISYVQVGNRHYRMDGRTGQPIDGRTGDTYNPAARSRDDDADPSELQALAATPYEKVPAGYQNGGMTYAEAFEKEHGYIPSDLLGSVNRLSQQQPQSQSQSTSIKLPSGRVFNVPAGVTLGGGGSAGGGGGGADTSASAQDQQDDSDGE